MAVPMHRLRGPAARQRVGTNGAPRRSPPPVAGWPGPLLRRRRRGGGVGDGLVRRLPLDAALGQRVLVSAQLVAPVLALVRPVELVVVHRHRVLVLLDDRGPATGLELLLQELLLLGGGLELDALAV